MSGNCDDDSGRRREEEEEANDEMDEEKEVEQDKDAELDEEDSADEDGDEEDDDDDDDDDDDSDDASDSDDDSDDSENKEASSETNGAQVKEKLDEDVYKTKLAELETQIVENKFQYQSHVDIIKLARDNADLETLRRCRQRMSEIFPLSESLWLEWLRDESKLVTTSEERSTINELFERAVRDYLSVDVWLEYIQFSIGGMGEPGGLERVRGVCERAIGIAGLHVTKGFLLWEVYREFESALLNGYKQSFAASVQTPEQEAKLNEQIERIGRLFVAQLGVCLDHASSTLNELREFDESKLASKELESDIQRVAQLHKRLSVHELALVNCGEDTAKKLAEYKAYLDDELKMLGESEHAQPNKNVKSVNKTSKKDDDDQRRRHEKQNRMRVTCLFERAIADDSNCLDVSLWLKYIYFLNDAESNHSNNSDEYRDVLKRSVRNCPWSSRLWILHANALERNQATSEVLKSTYNAALNAGLQSADDYLQMWHAYLDFLRRSFVASHGQSVNTTRTNDETKNDDSNVGMVDTSVRDAHIEEIREAFQKAINQLFEYFKNTGDPTFSLEKYWALVEAKHFRCMEHARKIYNEQIMCKGSIGKHASEWLEFYDLERSYGDEKHQRKLLTRALNQLDANNDRERAVILHELLKFEKLNGNVSQANNAFMRYEEFKEQQLVKQHQQQQQQQQQHKPFQTRGDGKAAATNNNGRVNKKQEPPKREAKSTLVAQTKKRDERETSTSENNLKRKKSASDDANEKDKDGFLIPSLPISSGAATNPAAAAEKTAEEKQATAVKKQKRNEAAAASESTPSGSNAGKFSDLTVFISNLSFDLDESKLRSVFEKEAGFKEVRLLRHWSGKSKGYGYVDFEKPEQAAHALRLDRTPVDGRPMFVSKNEDKSADVGVSAQSKFKYATNLEKTKLFVTGLPFSTDKSALEDIFKNFGKVKEARIVTYKNGKSKGIAYVEFEDEASASKALIQTDGMLIGDFQISVAISNPPKRNDPLMDKQSRQNEIITRSLGSGSMTNRNAPSNSSGSDAASASKKQAPSSTPATFLPRSQMMNRKKTLSLL